MDHIHTFLTIQGHGRPPRMNDQLNAEPSPRQHEHERRHTPFTHSFILVVDLGFTTLLTSQATSVAFYSEREKSKKFCSEALISDDYDRQMIFEGSWGPEAS